MMVPATAFKHSVKVPRFYKYAAKIFMDVKNGGNLKGLISTVSHPNKRGIMALVLKTLQHSNILETIYDHTGFLKKEANLNEHLAAVLTTELLWGKKNLDGESRPVETILRYEDQFLEAIRVKDLKLVDLIKDTVWRPRYVRVNTLRQSVDNVINYFTKRQWKLLPTPGSYPEFLELIRANLHDDVFIRDYHLDDFLLFPEGTVFAKNPLWKNGSIVLQDKSSSLAVRLLNAEPGSTILDMCAAPGMKTAHLAAYLKNEGKIYACDHDKERHKTLVNTLKQCNVKCVRSYYANVLEIKCIPKTNIEYILLDPTCSGTGMLSRLAYDHTSPTDRRIERLSNLQKKLLRYALTDYPRVKRVIYSTCSVNSQENEAVVQEALSYAIDFRLANCAPRIPGWTSVGLDEYECDGDNDEDSDDDNDEDKSFNGRLMSSISVPNLLSAVVEAENTDAGSSKSNNNFNSSDTNFHDENSFNESSSLHARKALSTSQEEFFQVLDSKIENGPDYDETSDKERLLENTRIRQLLLEWERAKQKRMGHLSSPPSYGGTYPFISQLNQVVQMSDLPFSSHRLYQISALQSQMMNGDLRSNRSSLSSLSSQKFSRSPMQYSQTPSNSQNSSGHPGLSNSVVMYDQIRGEFYTELA